VRAEARGSGGPLVEGEPGTGEQAVVIDDVVASGGSPAEAQTDSLAGTPVTAPKVRLSMLRAIGRIQMPRHDHFSSCSRPCILLATR
jgi:hypothetical protein